VARVLALVPDLLFGSQVQGALRSAGHEVELTGDPGLVRERLAHPEQAPAVVVVDLTDAAFAGAELVRSLAADGALGGARTLGFYAHVDVDVREEAERAGFDLVVPRSRMAREGAALVAGLAAGGP